MTRFVKSRMRSARRTRRRTAVVDSCGCAMGARFLATGLASSTLWYAWQWCFASLSLRGALLRVLAWSVVASIVGKTLGILLFRLRARRIKTASLS
jgi:hypothetical protein